MTSEDKMWESLKSKYLREVEKALSSVKHPRTKEVVEDVRLHLEQRFTELEPDQRDWEGFQGIITGMGPPADYADLLVPGAKRTSRGIKPKYVVGFGLAAVVLLAAVILLPIAISGKPRSTTPAEFRRNFPENIGKFEIDTAALNDVIKTFGEPVEYMWQGRVFDRNNLPRRYLIVYPDGFHVLMANNKVIELRHEGPGTGYVWRGKLRVGSSLDEVLEVVGEPTETIEGGPSEWKDCVLYKDIDGRRGHCYYKRADQNVRFFFGDCEVAALYVTRSDAGVSKGSFQTVLPIKSVKAFDDVRWKDMSKLDLSKRTGLIATLKFNKKTIWPESTKLPAGVRPEKLLAGAMNPGLGVRRLHQQGITGRGVNVAIIDQAMYLDHPEFAGKVVAYHDLAGGEKRSMHGPAVTSLLVGKNCGTAPGARVYYAAVRSGVHEDDYARALEWIIKQNESLPASEKIRVVSVSAAPGKAGTHSKPNQKKWNDAYARAEAQGILVLDCTDHHCFIGKCWYDFKKPESVALCTPGDPRRRYIRGFSERLLAPTAPRTTAEEYDKGDFSYQYCGYAGLSWAIPYCAGVLALGWQVNPELGPGQMRELLFESAYTKSNGAKIINPKKFILLARMAKAAPRQNQQQKNSREHSETNTIVPGLRVGDYKLGMSKDDVLKSLGKPKVIFHGEEKYTLNNLPKTYFMRFDDISFEIVDDSVQAIVVHSPLYKFTNGLGVGDSEQEFKQAFGLKFKFEEDQGKLYLTYKDEGLQFIIHKSDRKVMEIGVSQKISLGHSGNNIIIPGVRVGDYKLGMSKDEVLKSLRKTKGDSLREAGNSISVDGVILNIIDDSVKSIDVLSSLYKFANGLGVGDSEQKIKQAFGDDFHLKETEGKDFLIYRDEGIQFEIHKKNRTVMELSITKKISHEPRASFVKPIKSVKPYNDVRWRDLSKLDLSARRGLINTLTFNQKTVWPEQAKMPPGSDPNKILTDALNPGLGVRKLHQQGITGKGVNVAIIDQPTYLVHPEFAGKIVAYHDTGCETDESSMHGPLVASLLVGTNCGTAPGARVYYAAAPSWKMDAAYYAKGLDWIIAQNEKLPEGDKIRVVSVSASPNQSSWANRQMWDRACARAEADGIMVLDCTDDSHRGFIGRCWYNARIPESVAKCNPWAPPNREFRFNPNDISILVPSSPRTAAEDGDVPGYQYAGRGGLSRAIPYCAGVLAMGWQVNPELPPEQMRELLFQSAYTKRNGAKIINPKRFINLVRNAKI